MIGRILAGGMIVGSIAAGLLNPGTVIRNEQELNAIYQTVNTETRYAERRACDTYNSLSSIQGSELGYPEIEWIRRELSPGQFRTDFENPKFTLAARAVRISDIGRFFDYRGLTVADAEAMRYLLGIKSSASVRYYPVVPYYEFLQKSKGKTSVDGSETSGLRDGFLNLCNRLGSGDYLKPEQIVKKKIEDENRSINVMYGAILGMAPASLYMTGRRRKNTGAS